MGEKRYFKRVKFETDLKIDFAGKTFEGELLDISFKGALLHTEVGIPMKKGEICRLNIHLPSSGIKMNFEAQLIHIDNNHLGFKFSSEDVDTMAHHKRLLELNLGSAEDLDREIASWLKN